MTKEYNPDVWQVIEIVANDTKEVHHRILAGWFGGYTSGEWWKFSSGVVKIIDCDPYWEIPNHSGSIYRCHKDSERLSGYTTSIYNNLTENAKLVTMELVKLADIIELYK